MQIKTTRRYYFTPLEWLIKNKTKPKQNKTKTENNKF